MLEVTEYKIKEAEEALQEVSKSNEETEKKNKKLKRKILAKNILITVLIIIIILLLLRSCGSGVNEPIFKTDVGVENGNGHNVKDDIPITNKEKLYVTMPVITDFAVSSQKPEITLYCPIENKGLFLITYTFVNEETGEIVYQSEPAAGGEKWEVNFKELLEPGEYKIRASLSSQYEETDKAANGTASSIIIKVRE